MNPPQIKNVTSPGPRPAAANRNRIVAVVAVLAVLLLAYKLLHHHRNRYEATADAVTIAIANNNMAPVEHAFNAIRQPELENKVHVAELAEFVAPLGHFKSSKEITPADSPAGFHAFTETFTNGTAYEKYELDSDGKIVKFHIGPVPSASSGP